MKTLVFLLEEPSAKAMLEGVIRKIVPTEIDIRYIVFEGKQDLEKRVVGKLRGWKTPETCFLVMRDQDSGDCYSIKSTLQTKVDEGGKTPCTLVRIACRELESFYLGDLAAVERGLNISGISRKQSKSKYRAPDTAIGNPADELRKLTKGEYQKVSGSRAISPHMNISSNTSISFRILIDGVKKLLENCNGC